MATKVPVKSILKQQPTPTTPSDEAKAKAEKDRHNLSIALNHAHKLQDRKDWQTRILKATEILLDYPHNTPHSDEEATKFTSLIQPFQPSDLDELVEERRIDGKCGYPLCAKQPRSETVGRNAEWKFGKGAASFCSAVCGKKNAYVKAQLSSVPAWERVDGRHPEVLLHEDDRPAVQSQPVVSRVTEGRGVANGDGELAFERGEKPTSFKPKQVMTDRVVEKAHVEHKPMSSVYDAEVSSTAIEGYEPKRKEIKIGHKDDEDSDEDEDDAEEQQHEDEND